MYGALSFPVGTNHTDTKRKIEIANQRERLNWKGLFNLFIVHTVFDPTETANKAVAVGALSTRILPIFSRHGTLIRAYGTGGGVQFFRYTIRFSPYPTSMTKIASEKVLVLDFGSQYAQLIARRVREQQVYCEIVRHDITAERMRELAPKGLILSGGPASVYETGAPKCDPRNLPPRHCRCWASATACSWPARPWAAGWKARRPANMAAPIAGS